MWAMTSRIGRRSVLAVLLAISMGRSESLIAQSNGATAVEPGPASAGAGGNASSAAVAAKSGDMNGVPPTAGTQSPASGPVLLSAAEKRKALEKEADHLVAMATELKARVDKTNKNILSLTVVAQAELIEHYAHQLKVGDTKK